MLSYPDFDSLWDYDQPAETEKRFRSLLTTIAGDADYRAQLLTQIARAQGLQHRFADAHRTLDTVQASLTEGNQPRTCIRYPLERGRVFNSSGQREKASEWFRQAYKLALSANEDFYAVDAAHMLGLSEPPERQLEWSLRALELAEQSPDPRAQKWRGSLYNNIGWTYHDQGHYPKALELFQRALDWREAQGQTREIRIARWCIARTLRSLNRVEDALAIQYRLLEEHQQNGSSDGYVNEEIAECLMALGRASEARPYFAQAYAEPSQDAELAANEPARLGRLTALGVADKSPI